MKAASSSLSVSAMKLVVTTLPSLNVEVGVHGTVDVLAVTHAKMVGVPPIPEKHWANVADLALKLNVPEKVLRAKLAKMIERGQVCGCACGCRGDLYLPDTWMMPSDA